MTLLLGPFIVAGVLKKFAAQTDRSLIAVRRAGLATGVSGDPRRKSFLRKISLTRLEREVQPYRQALAANPKDIDARMQIGIVYARNGVMDSAQREFDAVLEIDPRNASALNNCFIGIIRLEIGRDTSR